MAFAAEVFLGDFCWRILAQGEPIEDGSIYKLGVYQKDGGHFALYGVFDDDQAVHGSAERIGNTISLTLLGSADYIDEVVSETVKATLDSATLNGSSHSIGTSIDLNTNIIENFYVPHTMTLITCP